MEYMRVVEGGYVDDPADPGGKTNLGITEGTLKRYHQLRDRDLRFPKMAANLTHEHAEAIYFELYWVPSGAASFPWPFNLLHLDAAVNLGKPSQFRRSLRLVQRTLNVALSGDPDRGLVVDGLLGPKTQRAIETLVARRKADIKHFYLRERRRYYLKFIGTRLSKFIAGWMWRLEKLDDASDQK